MEFTSYSIPSDRVGTFRVKSDGLWSSNVIWFVQSEVGSYRLDLTRVIIVSIVLISDVFGTTYRYYLDR